MLGDKTFNPQPFMKSELKITNVQSLSDDSINEASTEDVSFQYQESSCASQVPATQSQPHEGHAHTLASLWQNDNSNLQFQQLYNESNFSNTSVIATPEKTRKQDIRKRRRQKRFSIFSAIDYTVERQKELLAPLVEAEQKRTALLQELVVLEKQRYDLQREHQKELMKKIDGIMGVSLSASSSNQSQIVPFISSLAQFLNSYTQQVAGAVKTTSSPILASLLLSDNPVQNNHSS